MERDHLKVLVDGKTEVGEAVEQLLGKVQAGSLEARKANADPI
jgi:hypothetical protein